MKKTLKIAVSGMCGLFVSAGVLVSGAGATAVSTDAIKTNIDAAEVLSQDLGASGNKAVQDAVFDGNQNGGMGKAGAVSLNLTIGPSANATAAQAKPAAKSLNGSVPALGNNVTVKESSAYKMSGMEASGKNIYRSGVYTETKVTTTKTPVTTTTVDKVYRPWWKIWAPEYTEVSTTKTEEKVEEKVEKKETPALEKAVAGPEGGLFNEKGEFVGRWKTIQNADLKAFSVVQDRNGQDHIYNWTDRDGVRQVLRDGKPAGVFAATAYGGKLADTRIGADGKIYAKYQAATDVIVSVAPGAAKPVIVAKLPVQTDVWDIQVSAVSHYEDYGHFINMPGTPGELKTDRKWDSDLGEYRNIEYYVPGTPPYNQWHKDGRREVIDVPAHTEKRSATYRVGQFEVDRNGRLVTLFRGNVLAENTASGYRNGMLDGQRYALGDKMDPGSTKDFKIDAGGNLYTLNGAGLLSVNGIPVDAAALGLGPVDKLTIDPQGNLYTVGADGLPRQYPVGQGLAEDSAVS